MRREELRADRGGEKPVNAEVVPFEHIAGEAGEGGFALCRAEFEIELLRRESDLRADEIEAAQLLDAVLDAFQLGRGEDALKYEARIRHRDQRDVLGRRDVLAE